MSRLLGAVAGFLALVALTFPVRAQLYDTKAAYAFLIDAGSGTVLFSKDADKPIPPASLAKLMTAELVFDALKKGRLTLADEFPVSEHAWRTGGAPSGTATMFAAVNSSVPLEALIQGIIVHQANDACIIVAEGLAGSEGSFAARMTERARALGLEKSTFVNPTGLPAEGQQTTVREVALLSRHLWQEYPEYYHYYAQPDFEWNRIRQRNRNPLLRLNIGADGLATGFTEGVGYAIAASAERQGRRLFLALGGIPSEEERAEEARKMLEWGFDAFEERELFAAGELVGAAYVYGGEKRTVALRAEGALSALLPVGSSEQVSARVVYEGPVPAPVEEGTPIGSLEIRIGDMVSRQVPLYAAETVNRGTLSQRALDAVQELLVGWMR